MTPEPTKSAVPSEVERLLRIEVARIDAGKTHFDCARRFEEAAEEIAQLRAELTAAYDSRTYWEIEASRLAGRCARLEEALRAIVHGHDHDDPQEEEQGIALARTLTDSGEKP